MWLFYADQIYSTGHISYKIMCIGKSQGTRPQKIHKIIMLSWKKKATIYLSNSTSEQIISHPLDAAMCSGVLFPQSGSGSFGFSPFFRASSTPTKSPSDAASCSSVINTWKKQGPRSRELAKSLCSSIQLTSSEN